MGKKEAKKGTREREREERESEWLYTPSSASSLVAEGITNPRYPVLANCVLISTPPTSVALKCSCVSESLTESFKP